MYATLTTLTTWEITEEWRTERQGGVLCAPPSLPTQLELWQGEMVIAQLQGYCRGWLTTWDDHGEICSLTGDGGAQGRVVG